MILKPKWLTKIEPGHRFSKGLVGAWLFNEGGGDLAYDYSGNGNHGTLVGDTYSVPGKFGPALEFDATGDYVDIIGSEDLGEGPQVTVCAWVLARTDTGAVRTIVGKYRSGFGQWVLDVARTDSTHSDKAIFTLRTDSNKITRTTNAISMDVWHQIVGVYDGSNVLIYLDGLLASTPTAQTGDQTVRDYRIAIGATQSNSPLNFWNGQISDVLIYNRALNAGEIKKLYRDPFQMFKRNL